MNRRLVISLVLLNLAACSPEAPMPTDDATEQAVPEKAEESPLEKVTKLGVTTGQDFDNFDDDGGLNKSGSDQWFGITVNRIQTTYKSGKMNGFTLTINKAMSSPKEIRAAASKYCNFSDNDWKIDNSVSDFKTAEARNNKCVAMYTVQESSYIDLTIASPDAVSNEQLPESAPTETN
jgi:hypothetical protein